MMNSLNPLCTMKTNKLIAAALLPLLFSCAKENLNQIDKPENGGKYDFTINLIPSDDAVTRAFFSDENGIYWDTAEHSGGIIDKDNNKYKTTGVKIYPWENGDLYKNQASFEFSQTYSGMYKLFYPYDENATYDNIPFWVAPTQYSGVGTSKDIFSLVSDGEVDLTADNHDTGALTYYKVVGSYIRFLVYGKAGEKVKSISIQSEQKPSGKYFVNGNTNELNGKAYTDDSNTIKVAVTGDYTTPATKSAASGIYASVLPARPLKNTYTVETDKGWYKFESQNEANFAFGSIKDVLLNLENTKCKYAPAKLFIIGGATTAKWNAWEAIELSKVEGKNQFKVEDIKLNAGDEGDSGFKFLTQKGSWDNVYVNGMNDNKTITYYENAEKAGKDIKFFVTESGHYNVVVDFDTNEVTCTKLEPKVYTYPEGSEVAVNMSFSETEDVYKAVIYLAKGDGKHDFKINYDNKYYHVNVSGYQVVNFSLQENEKHTISREWDVVADETDKGWYVVDEFCNKYYELTFDSTNNKVSLKLAQGQDFWLIGKPFGGYNANKPDQFKATADANGIATWNVTTTETGDFKICGKYTLEDSFYRGEWYYSTDKSGFNWSGDLGNNYSTEAEQKTFNVLLFFQENDDNNKWKLNETGKFTIVFDTKNLTIKVYKTN